MNSWKAEIAEAGELFRVGKAVYIEERYIPEFAVLVVKYPNAVVTKRNAFFMHGLTDTIPDGYDLATDRDAAKIRKKVKQYFQPPNFMYTVSWGITFKLSTAPLTEAFK